MYTHNASMSGLPALLFWLTGCVASPHTPSLTLPLDFSALASAPVVSHVVRCVSSYPSPSSFWRLTIWWISARLRQGVRHGRIRYKLSLLQGTASHHESLSFTCLFHTIPTSSFSSAMFINFYLISFYWCAHISSDLSHYDSYPAEEFCRWTSWLWAYSHKLSTFFVRMLTDVSLSPPCNPTVELSVESKFGQSVLLSLNFVFEWKSASLIWLGNQLLRPQRNTH